MRVGIIALLHESNTFVRQKTTLKNFEEDILLTGESVRDRFQNTEHEVGGFFGKLCKEQIEAVPIFAARAYPSGVIEAETFDTLINRLLAQLDSAESLDGILAAPHGATVAENHPDADGYWLSKVRDAIGKDVPLVATVDPHANISQKMVDATDAIIAYRTNPHLDQKKTGRRAAGLMAKVLRGEIRPTQAAIFPAMAMNIQCQNTDEFPLCALTGVADEMCSDAVSHSVIFGFPYSDVVEMGSSVIAVTDNDEKLAKALCAHVAEYMCEIRDKFDPEFTGVSEAIEMVKKNDGCTLLLDMGDNVGGGSDANSTAICSELNRNSIGPSFVCICDPESVVKSVAAGVGNSVILDIGEEPMCTECKVISLHDGKFRDNLPVHGGFQMFDQGQTAIVETSGGLTVMLTTLRMPPFSLEQLISCGIDPQDFRVIIAKGVIAPLAAYKFVCDHVIHVNSPGSTCADMTQLPFKHRRKPMFPFEKQ